jgi:hypothetical protein
LETGGVAALRGLLDEGRHRLDAANEHSRQRSLQIAHSAPGGHAYIEHRPHLEHLQERGHELGDGGIAATFVRVHRIVPGGGIRVVPTLNLYGWIRFSWHQASF